MHTFSTLGAASALLAFATPAAGPQTAPLVNKTWVSSTGSDTGSCQLVAPCKTFAYAISETNAGGEIDVKDSGAYGSFTISKDITIVASGVVASVGSGPDNDGINITTDHIRVDIIGLTVNTHSIASGRGVHMNCVQCAISLDHMNIQGNYLGVSLFNAGSVMITNSHIASNNFGIGKTTDVPICLGNNSITLNNYGLSEGTYCTYGTNQINGNILQDTVHPVFNRISGE